MSADLSVAVAAMHARLDDWAAAVVAAAAIAQGDEALRDPRLDAAEDEFDVTVEGFHAAARAALGVAVADDLDDLVVEAEELALHVLVGLPDGADPPPATAAAMVHAAGERLVDELSTAGYQVPAWQFGCDVDLLVGGGDVDGEDGT